MPPKSPAVDAYIAKAAPFARPILRKLRMLFRKACPQIAESMKWSCPHFEYKGIVGSMAAFKQHVSIGFWKAALMNDPEGLLNGVGNKSMAGTRVTSLGELPADGTLLAYIREAVRLNEEGVKIPRPKKGPVKPVKAPDYLLAALQKNKKAKTTFDRFSPSHQREYIEWITEAKQEATRQKRLAATLKWLAEGKPRNWKYMRRK
jgi:uncharacterized protein YdeI (YjbR/CyaY-like superfamily)